MWSGWGFCLVFIVLEDIWIWFQLTMVLELKDPGFIFLFQSHRRRCREPNFGGSSLSRLLGLYILGLTMLMWLVMLVGLLLASCLALLNSWFMVICLLWSRCWWKLGA